MILVCVTLDLGLLPLGMRVQEEYPDKIWGLSSVSFHKGRSFSQPLKVWTVDLN